MIDSSCISDGIARLGGELHRHIARVLRIREDTGLLLVDELGNEHQGIVQCIFKDQVQVRITASSTAIRLKSGDAPCFTICQALPKGEKTDLILQKGTELGASGFLLFGGRRSVPRIRDDQVATKLERWNKITAEASRQCGRHRIPGVTWHPDATGAAAGSPHELRLLLWEDERGRSLKNVLDGYPRPVPTVVAIGPEGGFDPSEVDCFRNNGFLPVTLGKNILRTETAAIAICSILQYIWGTSETGETDEMS